MYKCKKCGSSDLIELRYVNINSDEQVGLNVMGGKRLIFCHGCKYDVDFNDDITVETEETK